MPRERDAVPRTKGLDTAQQGLTPPSPEPLSVLKIITAVKGLIPSHMLFLLGSPPPPLHETTLVERSPARESANVLHATGQATSPLDRICSFCQVRGLCSWLSKVALSMCGGLRVSISLFPIVLQTEEPVRVHVRVRAACKSSDWAPAEYRHEIALKGLSPQPLLAELERPLRWVRAQGCLHGPHSPLSAGGRTGAR